MPRTGRPRLRDDERLSHSLLVRVSPAQLKALREAAGHEPLASYVRRVALRAATRKVTR